MDITATYGDHIGDIQFNYQILESVVNQTAALELLKASHQAYVSTNAIAVIDGLTQTEITNLRATLTAEQNKLSLLVTLRALFNARTFSVESNKLVLNTDFASLNRFYIVDLNKVSFQNYLANTGNATLNLQSTLSPNASGGFISRAMVSQTVLNTNAATVNGYVNALVNAGYMQTLRFMEANAVVSKVPLFNRQFVHQLNGITSGGGGLVQLISGGGGLVQIISGIAQSLPDGQPVILNDGSVIANVNGGGGLVQLISSAGEPIRVPEGQPYTLSNGDQIVNAGGGLLQIISAGGGLLQIISGGGGLLQIISGVPVTPDPVPLTSQVTNGGGGLLQIISTGVPLANARLVLASGGGGLLQIISGGGGLLQIISGGGGLVQLISGGGGLLQIISGGGGLLQLISSASGPIPISNSGAGYGLTSNTATILDETDAAVGNVGPMMGINLVSGLNAGTQFILGGAFLNDNFNVTNGIGELLISKANQTISFTQALPDVMVGDDPINLTATASSGLPVSYTVSGPATISGNVLTITGAGTVSVTATQAGNSNYHAASPVNRTFNVATDPCIITHGTFTNFSTTNGKTTMWVNVKIKLGGELANDGDYLEFKNGTAIFNNITGSFINNSPIPKGRVEARAGITEPQTTYDPTANSWLTLVPVGFSTSSDIFIAGAVVNSSNGFKKGKNASTAIAGAFRSNVQGFKTHWLFGMGAYQSSTVDIFAVFTLTSLQGMNQVIPVNGTYKSGTPVPHIAYIVNGGTGSGTNNFAGNTSSLDQFNACIVAPSLAPVTMQKEMPVQKLDAQLVLAPNPAKNAFNLSFVPSVTGQTTIRIYSINGALISEEFAGQAEGGQLYTRQVKSHAYRPGMYLVQMVNQGQVITRKLVIMNDR